MDTEFIETFESIFSYNNEIIGHWSDFDCNGVHVYGINIKNSRIDECFSIVWDKNTDKYSLYSIPIDIDDPMDYDIINLDNSNIILIYVDLQSIIDYLDQDENENNNNPNEEENEDEYHNQNNNRGYDEETEDITEDG